MTTIERGLINKFNRGIVDPDVDVREDVEKIANSSEVMTNFLPERLGPMVYRSGSGYIVDTRLGADTLLIPFVRSLEEAVLLELTNSSIRVSDSDSILSGSTVTSTLTNMDFTTGTGWLNDDDLRCVSTSNTGELAQTGIRGQGEARVYQLLGSTQIGQPHVLEIAVTQGPVRLRMGYSSVSSNEIFDGFLGTGHHFIRFTPTSVGLAFTFSNDLYITTKIDYVSFLQSGDMILDMTKLARGNFDGNANFRNLRWDQSADVMFFASKGYFPFKVVSHGIGSWGIERYEHFYGPYEPLSDETIGLSYVFVQGDHTPQLTTDKPYFNSAFDYDGMLLKYVTRGQYGFKEGTVVDAVTEPVFLFGTARQLNVYVNATTGSGWSVQLQKSFNKINWETVSGETYNGINTNFTYNDGLTNVEVYYRLRVADAGTGVTDLDLQLTHDYGSVEVNLRLLQEIDANNAEFYSYDGKEIFRDTRDWYIGSWGGANPVPTALGFHEGRLFFVGNNKIWGSESDNYYSFDRDIEGASAAIQKTIGFGSVEDIHWLISGTRLIAGVTNGELSIRSDSLGQVMTDLNTNIKLGSNYGAAPIPPIAIDDEVLFVQRSKNKIISLTYSLQSEVHQGVDLNVLTPALLDAKVVRMDMVRNPETRVYVVMEDGTMFVLLYDRAEDIRSWSKIEAADGGLFKDVCVLPGVDEDRVYVVVERNGSTVIEKFASLKDAIGGSLSKHYDSYVEYTSPGTTLTGLGHLNGDQVMVWVDGVEEGPYTVSGGQVTGVTAGINVVAGLPYSAQYKSGRLTEHSDQTSVLERKRPINLGLIMKNYVVGSVLVGPESPATGNMPAIEDGKAAVSGDYKFYPFEFDSDMEVDPRIHIAATGPCKIKAITYDMKNSDKKTKKVGGN